MLMLLLAAQAVTPLLHFQGSAARLAFWVWLATFPIMVATTVLNWRQPGMWLLGFGLALNMVVIAANGGMPVSPLAVQTIQGASATIRIPATDFVHVAAGSSTIMPWLADVLPIPGPSWLRSVASAGDCMLAAGICSYLACCSPDAARKTHLRA